MPGTMPAIPGNKTNVSSIFRVPNGVRFDAAAVLSDVRKNKCDSPASRLEVIYYAFSINC